MKNLTLISASAGSGKTYTLTQKLVELVCAGKIHPGKIIATTFTVKAANELKSRIREGLLKVGMTREANMLNESLIGTINSVGLGFMKKYAFYAGFSPRLDTLEDEESGLILQELLGDSIDGDFLDLAGKLLQVEPDYGKDEPKYLEHISTIMNMVRSNAMKKEDLEEFAETSIQLSFENIPLHDRPQARQNLFNILEGIVNDPVFRNNNLTANQKKNYLNLRGYYDNFKNGEESWDNWRTLSSYNNLVTQIGNERLDRLKDAASGVIHLKEYREDYARYVKGCFAAAGKCLDNFAAIKKEKGLLDFTDQDALLYDLLMHNTRIRAAIQQDYDLVVVDEFQDVSPIQLGIFLELTKIVEKNIWVGDPKQCIYAFRGADPELMTSVIEKVPLEQREILGNSYRSRKELVYFSNCIFSEAFQPAMKLEEIVLEPAREKAGTEIEGIAPVQYWKIENGDFTYMAQAIEDLMARNKNLRYGDIAILCRKNKTAWKIAEEMGEMKIPVAVGGTGLRYEPEVIVLCAFLKLLEQPEDTLAKAEVMLYCCYDGDKSRLIEERLKAENVYVWEKGNSWLAELEEIRKISKDFSVSRALEVLISRMNVGSLLAHWGNWESRMANLDKLISYAVTYGTLAGKLGLAQTISGFLTWLEEKNSKSKDEKGVKAGNSVEVITYHAGKGLEWPVVILYDLHEKLKDPLMGVKVIQDEGWSAECPLEKRRLILNIFPFNARANYKEYMDYIKELRIWKKAKAMQDNEERRLFYVGVTRAKDYLVFGSKNATAGEEEYHIPNLVNSRIGVSDLGEGEYEDRFEWNGEKIRYEKREYRSIEVEFFENKLKAVEHRYYGEEEPRRGEYELVKNNPSMEGRAEGMAVRGMVELGERIEGEGGKELGVMIHRVICAYRKELGEAENLSMIHGYLEEYGMEEMDAAKLLVGIERLMEYVGDGEVEREYPVRWMLEDGGVANGTADLLIRRKDGVEIVDYKTMHAEDLEGKALEYSGQLKKYGEMVEKASGEKVGRYGVYFVMEGKMVELG